MKAALREDRGGYRHAAAYAVTGLTIAFLFIFVLFFDFSPHKVALPLFYILGFLGLIEVFIIGDGAAQLFAEERRHSTLALIFGTGISTTEVLVGKLAAILVAPLSRLITLIPCLIIIAMMRGATIDVCIAAFLTLFVLIAFAVSLHLLSSLLFKEISSTLVAANLAILLLIGFLPALNFLNRFFRGVPIDRFWLSFNPATAPWLLFEHPQSNQELGYIYLSLLFTTLLSLGCFFASAVILSRIWKDQVQGTTSSRLANLLATFRARQSRKAKPLLESNPYEWLIQRDFRPALLTWSIIGGLALLWLLGFWHWGKAWLIPMNFWLTLLVLGALIRWMTHYLAARQIGLDRSAGSLELVLTSPLPVGDIISAQHSAIRRFVRPLYGFVASLQLLFFVLGLLFHPMSQPALINYVVISLLVAFFGPWLNFQNYWGPFWFSLNTGRPMFAINKQVLGGANWTWIVWFQFAFRIDRFPNLPSGSFGETLSISIIAAGVVLWYIFYRFCWTTDWNTSQKRRNLAMLHMRAIAAEPLLDISHDRVKEWNPETPLITTLPPTENDADPALEDERRRQRILQQHT